MREIALRDQRFRVSDSVAYRAFWDRVAQGRWEPHTFVVFDRFLCTDRCYFDVGAWIGPTVLYGAQRARAVHAFEPDPVARRELEINTALNPTLAARINISGYCVAPQTGPVDLYAGGLYATDGSRFGDSMTSLLHPADGSPAEPMLADGMTLEEFADLHQVRDVGFVKMDVEGGEFLILSSHRRHFERARPTLLVSFHAPPVEGRESAYRESFDVLESIYRCVYDSAGRPLGLARLADSVTDWTDDAPGSPWTTLETTTGAGIVASSEPW